MSSAHTDPLRRLALQLAIQLPEDVAEAHKVLGLTTDFYDRFLIEPRCSVSRRRALELGWGGDLLPEAAVAEPPSLAGATASLRSILWGLSSLLISLPLAMLLVGEFGAGAGFCFGIGVMVVALIFGTAPALVLGASSALLHNLVIVPPALQFQRASTLELIAMVGYALIAFLAPFVAARRHRIRTAVIGEVAAAPAARDTAAPRLVRSSS